MIDHKETSKHSTWQCPSDRYLTLRSQLNAGWSVKGNKPLTPEHDSTLSETEVNHIKAVLARAEKINADERVRVGRLVDRLERMKRNISGSRPNQCMLCGTKFGVMGAFSYAAYCNDCRKCVCQRNCGLETTDRAGKPIFLCKLCSEAREMWKKSGAWFYRGIPEHVKPTLRATRSVEPVPYDRKHQEYDDDWRRTLSPSSSKDSYASEQSDLAMSYVRHPSVRRMLPIPPTEIGGFRSNKPRWAIISRSRERSSLEHYKDSSSEEEDEQSIKSSSPCSTDQKQLLSTVTTPSSEHSVSRTSSRSLNKTNTPSLDSDRDTASENALPIVSTQQNVLDDNETLDSKSNSSGAPIENVSQRCSYSSSHHAEGKEEPVAAQRPTSLKQYDSNNSEVPKKNLSQEENRETTKLRSEHNSYESSPDNELGQRLKVCRTSDNSTVDSELHDRVAATELVNRDLNNGTAGFGSLEFSLFYDEQEEMLIVKIFKASNLPAKDSNGLSDPYVKLHLLPLVAKNFKATKLRTKTKPKTLNPCWNEQLVYYGISKDDLLRKTLRLMVLDEDRIGSDFLGETRVPLKRISVGKEKLFNVYLEKQMPVEKCDDLMEERGKINFSLCYDSTAKELQVEIIRCVELVGLDPSGYSDPYVKLKLKPETSKYHHFKTEVKKRTLNPEYNRVFRFPILPEDLPKKSLEIQVWDRDVGKQDDFIGSVELSATAKGAKLKHWAECLRNPNKVVKRWHKLVA